MSLQRRETVKALCTLQRVGATAEWEVREFYSKQAVADLRRLGFVRRRGSKLFLTAKGVRAAKLACFLHEGIRPARFKRSRR